MRLGYSQTVTRPDFREFSSTRYQDPTNADIVYGNEFLTYSQLEHIDLRYEWYMNKTDFVTLGLFSKDIENPIETVVFYTDVNPQFTYLNAESARLNGFEAAWHRELGSLDWRWRNWSVSGNYSYTESNIEVPETLDGRIADSLRTLVGELTSKDRPMQGQSPHVVNLRIGYETRRLKSSLVYNVIGKRIVSLGTEGTPDLYEEPFHQLDLIMQYEMPSGLQLGIKARNLIDDTVQWTQGGVDVRHYRKGRSLSLSASYAF